MGGANSSCCARVSDPVVDVAMSLPTLTLASGYALMRSVRASLSHSRRCSSMEMAGGRAYGTSWQVATKGKGAGTGG